MPSPPISSGTGRWSVGAAAPTGAGRAVAAPPAGALRALTGDAGWRPGPDVDVTAAPQMLDTSAQPVRTAAPTNSRPFGTGRGGSGCEGSGCEGSGREGSRRS